MTRQRQTLTSSSGPREASGYQNGRRLPRAVMPFVMTMVAWLVACGADETALPGTDLRYTPAPEFRLTDQAGRSVAMSDLRGKAVVLTFLFTRCPDFCPMTAEKLRQTIERLGRDAAKTAIVAISLDPIGDDQASVRAFSDRHRLPDANWHYLTGSEAELRLVWQAYAIGRLTAEQGGGRPDGIGHTEVLYLIDRDGNERSLLRGDFQPEELAAVLRKLAR